MATIPATILISTSDENNLPQRLLFVIAKKLFIYGVKNIVIKRDIIVVSLSYSPKAETLAGKFRNLPVNYMRVKPDYNDEELLLLGQAINRFNLRYNAVDIGNFNRGSSINRFLSVVSDQKRSSPWGIEERLKKKPKK